MNKASGFSQSALAGRLNRLIDFAPVLIALLLALVVASVLLLALNANPLEAYDFMLKGAVGSENATAETLVKATPILFVGIGITIAFPRRHDQYRRGRADDRRRSGWRHHRARIGSSARPGRDGESARRI